MTRHVITPFDKTPTNALRYVHTTTPDETDFIDGYINEEYNNAFKETDTYANVAAAGDVDPNITYETDAPLIAADEPVNLEDIYLNDIEYKEGTDIRLQFGYVFNTEAQRVYDWVHKRGEYQIDYDYLERAEQVGNLASTSGNQTDPMPHLGIQRQAYALFADQTAAEKEKKRLAEADKVQGEDISRFGLEWAAQLMYSDIGMLRGYLNVDDLPQEVALAQATLLERYHELGDFTGRGTIRFIKNILANPSTYFGLGSVGVVKNLLAQGGAKGLRQSMGKRLMRTALGASFIGAEGSAYGGSADYIAQVLEHGGSDEPFEVDWTRVGTAAGLGFGGGAVLSAGLGPAVSSVAKFVSDVRRGKAPVGLGTEDVTPGGMVSALKDAPEKVVEEATDLSPLGFYSAVNRAVDELPMEKGSAVQMRQMIAKTVGVKPEEMAWIGLDEFLKGKKKVSKQEIKDFVQANAIEVEEVVYSKAGGFETGKRETADEIELLINNDEMLYQRAGEIQPLIDRYRNMPNDGSELATVGGELVSALSVAGLDPATAQNMVFRDLDRRISGAVRNKRGKVPRFDQPGLVLPGGQNYREIALKLITPRDGVEGQPRIDVGFFGKSHIPEENVLAHLRLNDRTGPNGERILFAEEIQSDWHQTGHRTGYRTPELREKQKSLQEQRKEIFSELERIEKEQFPELEGLTNKRIAESLDGLTDAERNRYLYLTAERDKAFESIHKKIRQIDSEFTSSLTKAGDTPFKKNWAEMTFRRLVRMATEEGYDSVAWTPGKLQAERYDLSKWVDEIRIKKIRGGSKDGQYYVTADPGVRKLVTEDKLPELVGKDLANRAIEDAVKYPDGRDYAGVDLELGGTWMADFYDQRIRNYANKFGKKFGAKVGTTTIESDKLTKGPIDRPYVVLENGEPFDAFASRRQAEEFVASADGNYTIAGELDVPIQIWTLPITKKMRETVMKKGVPLMSVGGAVTTGAAAVNQEAD